MNKNNTSDCTYRKCIATGNGLKCICQIGDYKCDNCPLDNVISTTGNWRNISLAGNTRNYNFYNKKNKYMNSTSDDMFEEFYVEDEFQNIEPQETLSHQNEPEMNHSTLLSTSEEKELAFQKQITCILQRVKETLIMKNHDYGYSFDRQWDHKVEQGKNPLDMVDTRLTDKYYRFEQLINNKNLVGNESLQDTLLDIIGYCTLTIRKLNEK